MRVRGQVAGNPNPYPHPNLAVALALALTLTLGGRWLALKPWRWSRSHARARNASRAAVLTGVCRAACWGGIGRYSQPEELEGEGWGEGCGEGWG